MDTIMGSLMTFLNVTVFLAVLSRPLSTTYIVFSIGFYMRLCSSIGFSFTRAVTSIVDFGVSARRINSFLLMRELNLNQVEKYTDKTIKIEIKNLNFKWDTV